MTPLAHQTTPLLFVVIEGRRFAIRLEQVDEVLPLAEPAPVPGWPRYGLGLLDVRGSLVPLVDVRSTLQLPDVTLSHRQKVVVVLTAGGERWGVLVSEVLGVVAHALSALEGIAPQPRLIRPDVSREFAIEAEGAVAVLDASALIAALGLPPPAEAVK